MKGMEGGFKSAEAARTLGKATTGMMMMNAAWVLRNSSVGGPKYYHIYAPQDDPNKPLLEDARPFQPFVSYLFLAELAKSISTNQPLNITSNEMVDAIAGIRRLSEVPVFSIVDTLRALNSTDPAVIERAIKTPAGQFFASFFVPLRTITELYGGFADDEKFLSLRDTEGQELVGPTISNIPGLAAAALPARVSQWTGEPMVQAHPLRRQFTGVGQTEVTRLQDLAMSTPDVDINAMIGEQGSPEATALVSQKLGKILTTEINGRAVGDILAAAIESEYPDPVERREVLQEVFTELREAAVEEAEQENPKAFIDREINKVPTSQREAVRKELIKLGLL